jgi:hypothetical protein
MEQPRPFQDITSFENNQGVLRIKKSAVNYKDKENSMPVIKKVNMKSNRSSVANSNKVLMIPKDSIRMNNL